MAGYWSYRAAAALARVLPLGWAYELARAIALLFYVFDRRARRGVAENLLAIAAWKGEAPDRQVVARQTRECFANYGRFIVDFFRYAHIAADKLPALVRIEKLERLHEARSRGRGVLIVSAHLGNWELGGAVLRAAGFPLWAAAVAQRPRLERFLSRQRERRGVHVVAVGAAARVLLRRLASGECVALLADRCFSTPATSVELFGRRTQLPRGPSRLAILSGAPIVPTFFVRESNGTFVLMVGEPIDPQGLEEGEITRRLRDALQQAIAAYPTQWFLFHPFWEAEKWSRA